MKNVLIAVAAMSLLAAPANAQTGLTVTVAPSYRSFSLDESLAAQSASLMLLPVAVSVPLGRSFAIDAYAAYASGSIETASGTLSLDGPVDTQLRGTWAALPFARVTLGVNVPTGNGTHSSHEAQVAALLSTDLLGFREARFGTGLGVTTGLALAHQLGEWAVGYGASYRYAGEFQPLEESDTVYAPGSEILARFAVDRNVGASSKLTLGGSYQHIADAERGTNLFKPGARARADASYAMRTGASSTLLFYVADLWRQQGQFIDPTDTTAIGAQNVIIVGTGADLGSSLRFSPRADVRVLSHEEGTGSGWIAGVGTGIELGIAGVRVVPRARFMIGALESEAGGSQGLTGYEVELVARF